MADGTDVLRAALLDKSLTSFEKFEHHCGFCFENQTLTVECPWRIVSPTSVLFGNDDDGQRFGMVTPKNARVEVQKLLVPSRIANVSLNTHTGDLTLSFENELALQVLNMSCGYEGWNLTSEDFTIVAQGGGNVVIHFGNEKVQTTWQSLM